MILNDTKECHRDVQDAPSTSMITKNRSLSPLKNASLLAYWDLFYKERSHSWYEDTFIPSSKIRIPKIM